MKIKRGKGSQQRIYEFLESNEEEKFTIDEICEHLRDEITKSFRSRAYRKVKQLYDVMTNIHRVKGAYKGCPDKYFYSENKHRRDERESI